MNRAVLDALAQQPADALIDLGLHRFDVGAHVGRQVLVLRAHHAPAEFRGDGLAVVAQYRPQPLAGRRLERSHLAEGGADAFDAGNEALEQELLLVADIVVDGGLGHLERRGDVIE